MKLSVVLRQTPQQKCAFSKRTFSEGLELPLYTLGQQPLAVQANKFLSILVSYHSLLSWTRIFCPSTK